MDTALLLEYHGEASCEDVVAASIPGYFTILRNILSPAECMRIIAAAEDIGFTTATLKGPEHYDIEYRKSERCIIDSVPFAETLWSRLKAVVPPTWDDGNYTVIGLNERMRILKYGPGDEFKMHADGTFIRRGGVEMSKITLLVYLNDEYEGGRTTYMCETGDHYEVVPTAGAAVLQDQNILHYVPALTAGVKYALRTDVMYRVKSADAPVYKTITIS